MKKMFTKGFLVSNTYLLTSVLLFCVTQPIIGSVINHEVEEGFLFAQNQETVSGTVSSADGPIAGVTVTVKGSSHIATSTDSKGNYSIQAPLGSKLVFSAMGYVSQEKIVESKLLNVLLQRYDQDIDEVVVVAFGTQKKENLTGSVATISPKQLAERPVTSLQNALQGVSPGITVISRPLPPKKGNNATITVRGRSNLQAPGPMYIIDGIPATAAEFAAITPADISSMSVLKDAASASLYGSRAANGVIW